MFHRRVFSERQICSHILRFKELKITPEEYAAQIGIPAQLMFFWLFKYEKWSWPEILSMRRLKAENRRLRDAIAAMNKPSPN